MFATSATVRNPNRSNCSSVFGPTPQSAATGKGCKKSITRSGGTNKQPFGLIAVDASFAKNLLDAIPTEQVIFCSSSTRARICSAIKVGVPNLLFAPLTSRKASSSEIASTSGVISENISITASLTSLYLWWLGEITIADGAKRFAVLIGIAAWTPIARAS